MRKIGRNTKTGGRQEGTPNKIRAEVVDDLLAAFEQLGGINYLVRVGKTDPPPSLHQVIELM